MTHRLTSAMGDWCGPVAVGAITGKTKEEVEHAICDAAGEDGESLTPPLKDTNFRHQTRAVERLGFELFERDGITRVQARSIDPYPTVDLCWLSQQPTAAEFLRDNVSDDPFLCFACRLPQGPGDNFHTFAVHNHFYYDNNTERKVETSVPAKLADFRVFRALAVRDPRR